MKQYVDQQRRTGRGGTMAATHQSRGEHAPGSDLYGVQITMEQERHGSLPVTLKGMGQT
jgi:hypothetical protein